MGEQLGGAIDLAHTAGTAQITSIPEDLLDGHLHRLTRHQERSAEIVSLPFHPVHRCFLPIFGVAFTFRTAHDDTSFSNLSALHAVADRNAVMTDEMACLMGQRKVEAARLKPVINAFFDQNRMIGYLQRHKSAFHAIIHGNTTLVENNNAEDSVRHGNRAHLEVGAKVTLHQLLDVRWLWRFQQFRTIIANQFLCKLFQPGAADYRHSVLIPATVQR